MKDKLKEVLANPKGKLIAVDLDNTLSEGENWGQDDPAPIPKMIDFVNDLYCRGGHIIIYTARRPAHYMMTHAWLIKHGVLFHGIGMQHKCGADIYIDDKALNVEDL